jgi:hypothetical protein
VNYQKEIASLFASLTFFREIIVRDGRVNAGLKVLNTAKIIVLSPINIYAPP